MCYMKIMILGANGYVGARLYFDLSKSFDAVGTYLSHSLFAGQIQLDITDRVAVKTVFDRIKPDVIIHAANNASAKWCDANPAKAVLLNQTATEYILQAAGTHKAKIIYISTMGADEVTNTYGHTKAASEKIVAGYSSGYVILRPSLILGYSPNTVNDRPFNRLLRNLDDGEPAIYDTSWKFQPTYLGHISEVISACLTRSIWNQSVTVSTPDLKSRYETARDILTPFGVKVFPVDKKDQTFAVFSDNLETLKKLKLPECSYDRMITGIVDEIRHREKFVV